MLHMLCIFSYLTAYIYISKTWGATTDTKFMQNNFLKISKFKKSQGTLIQSIHLLQFREQN